MINDMVKTAGQVSFTLRDSNGNIKEQKTVPNLIVTVGKTYIASRLSGNTTPVMSHMSVGTSAVTQIAANTVLGTEIPASRVTLTVPGGTPAGVEITYTATFPAGTGTGAIVEAGIFNDSVTGTMLARTTFGAVNKDTGDSLTIIWKVTIS